MRPLITRLIKHDINPQLVYINLTDPFMTYLKITLINAGAIAGPWIIYQIWVFVAAGLYPNERKMVTRYIPLSLTLFVAGLVFVYVLVLPLSIKFFIEFSGSLPMPVMVKPTALPDAAPLPIPTFDGDPVSPKPGLWINIAEGRLKAFVPLHGGKPGEGKIRVIPFGPENLLTPTLTLTEYIDLALTFMLTFGIAFQLPLVLLAVVSIGIVDLDFLRKKRKIIYFGMTVASAFLAPGDIVKSMLALLIPLIILYEFGLWLIVFSVKNKARRDSDTANQPTSPS